MTARVHPAIVGELARLLATVPEELRAGLCVEAIKRAKEPAPPTLEADQVAEMIG